MTFRSTRAHALLATALVVALCAPASAQAEVVDKDRSDNLFSFDYDDSTGTMPNQGSSATFTPNDKVEYFIYIRERPEGEPGERLIAKLRLKLIPERDKKGRIDWAATKRQVYDGTFTIDIDGENQPDAYVDSRLQKVVLTREKGHRSATIRFLFDLGSGTGYTAVSRFLAE